MASALQGMGLPEIWQRVQDFQKKLEEQSGPKYNRAAQARGLLWEEIQDDLMAAIRSDSDIAPLIAAREEQVSRQEVTPSAAAREILDKFLMRPFKP